MEKKWRIIWWLFTFVIDLGEVAVSDTINTVLVRLDNRDNP